MRNSPEFAKFPKPYEPLSTLSSGKNVSIQRKQKARGTPDMQIGRIPPGYLDNQQLAEDSKHKGTFHHASQEKSSSHHAGCTAGHLQTHSGGL